MQEQVIGFIEESLRRGVAREAIKTSLMKEGGWSSEEVDQAFLDVVSRNPSATRPVVPKHTMLPDDANRGTSALSPIQQTGVVSKPPLGFQTSVSPAIVQAPKPIIPKIFPSATPQPPAVVKPLVGVPAFTTATVSTPIVNQPSSPVLQTKTLAAAVPSTVVNPPLGFKTVTPIAEPPKSLAQTIVSSSLLPTAISKSPVQMYSMPSKPVASNKKFWAILISVFVLVLAGVGGAFAYYFYSVATPDEVLWKAIDNLYVRNNFDYSGTFTSETSGLFDRKSIQQIEAVGLAQRVSEDSASTSEKVQTSGNFVTSVRGSADREHSKGNMEFSLSADGSTAGLRFGASVNLEFLLADGNIYAVIRNAPDIGYDLNPIKNIWIKSTISEALGQVNIDSVKVDEWYAKSGEIYSKFKELGVATVSEKLPDEVVNGVSAYHYKIVLNKATFRTFVIEAYKILGTPATDADLTNLDNRFGGLNTEGEVWVGKSDNNVYKLLLRSAGVRPDIEGATSFSIAGDFSNYDQPKDIVPLSPTKTIQEATSILFSTTTPPQNTEPATSIVSPALDLISGAEAAKSPAESSASPGTVSDSEAPAPFVND